MEEKQKTFVCEICGCETSIEHEGAEPNTCENCLPLRERDEEDCGYYRTRSRQIDYDD